MAPGPSLAGPARGPEPSFVSLHLSWPSHHCSTGPHLLPNVTPRQLPSPSIAPQSIHNAFLLFSKSSFEFVRFSTVFIFIHSTWFLLLQHFSPIEFFFLLILKIRKWVSMCTSAETERVLLSFPSFSSMPLRDMSRDFLLLLLHIQLILTVCMTLERKYCYSSKRDLCSFARECSGLHFTPALCA